MSFRQLALYFHLIASKLPLIPLHRLNRYFSDVFAALTTLTTAATNAATGKPSLGTTDVTIAATAAVVVAVKHFCGQPNIRCFSATYSNTHTHTHTG